MKRHGGPEGGLGSEEDTLLSRTIPAQSTTQTGITTALEYAYCGDSPKVLAGIQEQQTSAEHSPVRYLISLTPASMLVWVYCCCGNRGSGTYGVGMSKMEALQDVWARMSMFW